MMQREVFGRTCLLGALKLKVDEVYCLQTNAQEKSFDVTFSSPVVMDRVLALSREKARERPFTSFEIVSLDRPNFRLITIHMYNPYVTTEQMIRFLSNYGEVNNSTRRLMDMLGFWTGRTQFQVLLKEDPEGFEGLAHPPAFFNIGADRGFMFYSRQPPFCRKCRKQGHQEGACGFVRCRVCTAYGHEPKDCPHLGVCNICGKSGHFYRDCPEKRRSYADAAGAGLGGGESSSSRAGNGQRSRVSAEEENPKAIEDVFAPTEQDMSDVCTQEEQARPVSPPRKEARQPKKSAVKTLKKSGLTLGGNGNVGEGERGSKRKKINEEGGGVQSKGRREEREGEGEGLEDQGLTQAMEGVEGLTQGQVNDACVLALGDGLNLPPVSPLSLSGEGEGYGEGNETIRWSAVMEGEGEDIPEFTQEELPAVVTLPPDQQVQRFGLRGSSSVPPKGRGGGGSGDA